MEIAFKLVFFFAVLVFGIIVIGIFLLIIKALLLAYPEINLMGITFSPRYY